MSKFYTALPVCLALSVAPFAALAQTASTGTKVETDTTAQTDDAAQTDTAAEAESTATAESETVASEEAQSGGASVVDQLSLGEDADQPNQLGQTYTGETIGAWELKCIRTEEEQDPCQMYQLLEDGEGNAVAEFSLFRLPAGGKATAGATIVVPLETALPQQLNIAVDGGKARRYPYAFCNPVGCYARLGLTEDDVNAFKRGNKAVITIVPALAPDQKVELDLSLDGFTASFDKASVIQE